MIRELLLGLGMVAIIEGLVLALAPTRLREALELVRNLPPEQLRLVGLLALTIGVGLVSLAKA
jgi:uncharacterized protein YjeT (DUF2065 family)